MYRHIHVLYIYYIYIYRKKDQVQRVIQVTSNVGRRYTVVVEDGTTTTTDVSEIPPNLVTEYKQQK